MPRTECATRMPSCRSAAGSSTSAGGAEEALWEGFVLSGRVDSAAGLTYLGELRRRR